MEIMLILSPKLADVLVADFLLLMYHSIFLHVLCQFLRLRHP
jgi:hypothetical protein